MHELPKDLTNSLRSFRGSIYGNRGKDARDGAQEDVDLEKGQVADYGDKEFDLALDTSDSSLDMVCFCIVNFFMRNQQR